MEEEDVMATKADQCRHGLTTRRVDGKLMPAKRPTKLMTNSPGLAAEVERRRDGEHRHQQLMGGRAAGAARYPNELCEAVRRGLREEKRWKQSGVKCPMRLNREMKVEDQEVKHEEDEIGIQAWDDITGGELDPKEVRRARMR